MVCLDPSTLRDNHFNEIVRWPNRLCAIRDGAHGEQEAGIYGRKDQGAFAVVVAAGG